MTMPDIIGSSTSAVASLIISMTISPHQKPAPIPVGLMRKQLLAIFYASKSLHLLLNWLRKVNRLSLYTR
jgi:hypothetical protein